VGDACDPVDGTLDVRWVSVRRRFISAKGTFSADHAFDPSAGLTIRVRDGGVLDRTFVFDAADCVAFAAGSLRCKSPDHLSRARFSHLSSTRSKFELRFEGLSLSSPFSPGCIITITDGTTDRRGDVPPSACRLRGPRLHCHAS
jgi:hypothetical protein